MSATVLALVPHPDDAEFYAGGLLAKLAAEGGARVHIVVATDGRRGSFEADSETLIAARAEEMRRAATVIRHAADPAGLPRHGAGTRCLRVPCREKFIRAIRQLRPDVVVAEDPYSASLSRTRIIAQWPGLRPRRSTMRACRWFIPNAWQKGWRCVSLSRSTSMPTSPRWRTNA